MEILKIKNNHLKYEPEKEYGCICKNCGTVFIIKESEAIYVNNCFPVFAECPNVKCKCKILINHCTKFKNPEEKKQFIHSYDKE